MRACLAHYPGLPRWEHNWSATSPELRASFIEGMGLLDDSGSADGLFSVWRLPPLKPRDIILELF